MSRRRPLSPLLHVVALCAVALFNVAVVRSTVMRAAPALAMEHCGGMAGMASPPATVPGKADAKAGCAFCAAAAHPPVMADAVEPAIPGAIAWRPSPSWGVSGPRGPPAFRPMARGPPPLPMI